MSVLTLIFLVLAFALFSIAAIGIPIPPRYNLIAAGLAFWVLSVILSSVRI